MGGCSFINFLYVIWSSSSSRADALSRVREQLLIPDISKRHARVLAAYERVCLCGLVRACKLPFGYCEFAFQGTFTLHCYVYVL